MWIVIWCAVAYLTIGIVLTIYFYEPEADGWLWQILLWPLWIAAMVLI